MPRYFFDLHNDMDVPDPEGTEFYNLDAAKAHAIFLTRDMVAASATEHGRIDLGHCIDIRESDRKVAEIKFETAVRFERYGQPI